MKLIKKFIMFSLLVTLPINIFGLVWTHNVIKSYFIHDKLSLSMERGPRLYRTGLAEYLDLKARTLNLFGVSQSFDVELIIKENDLKKLNSDLPNSGMEYQDDGFMIYNNQALKGKLRYRGDHYYHWLFPKKSWRFKASKKNILDGIQKYNFIIPKDESLLLNHSSYLLAKSLNLLAPDSSLINLGVNGVAKGPRLMVEQIDESFLRKNRRMPNDVYKGDNIGASMYTGIPRPVFNHASIWDKPAQNNHYEENNKVPLNYLFNDFKVKNYDLVDKNSFAAMLAYIDLTGSGHHDKTHNWMFYYDAYYEKMFPVIWDTVGWLQSRGDAEEVNIVSAQFLEYLYNNLEFQKLKVSILLNFYNNGRKLFFNNLKESVEKAKALVEHNGYSTNLGRLYFTVEQALEQIELFQKRVQFRFDLVNQHFLGTVDKNHYRYQILPNNKLRIEVNGSKMINQIALVTNQVEQPVSATISYAHKNNVITNDISNLATSNNYGVIFDIDLLANSVLLPGRYGSRIENTAVTYDIQVTGIDLNALDNITLKFSNLEHQVIDLNRAQNISVKPFSDYLNHVITLPDQNETLNLSGEIRLTNDTTYHQNVTIEPGTTFLINNEVSLKFYGQVTAIGTADEPITFKPLNDKEPWNSVVVKDPGANGSRFSYCDFIGGSGAKGDLYEYTAMLSVHNVQDISFEHCGFYDSKRTDDMIHIIYSQAVFKHSKFVRSLADALDADISQIIIADSEFIDSGNDSIDLMTSDAIVYNTLFTNSADKGISIGEGSQLLAFDNTIINSEIGMQSKDTSIAYIYDTVFKGNNTAIDAYHKNWRYSEGGQITLEGCVLEGNAENATVGKKSQITLNNCDIDDVSNISNKDQRKNKITISQQDRIKHQLVGQLFELYSELPNQGESNASH